MWGYNDGWNAFWMVPMMLVVWGAVILLAILAIGAITGRRATDDQAIQTLRRRLASGEIDPDEFDKTKRLLQG
jgi:uncharacterized membrane protein